MSLYHQNGNVVKWFAFDYEITQDFKDFIHDCQRRHGPHFAQAVRQSLFSKALALAVASLRNSIGVKDQRLTGSQDQAVIFKFSVGTQPQGWTPFKLDCPDLVFRSHQDGMLVAPPG